MKRAIVFSFLLACSSVLLADSPDSRSPSLEPPSLLQELVRLTNGGLSDETILAYAKAHRAELPPRVSTDDLLWLRKSGVSETVIRYMSAIDVRASDAGAADAVAYDSRGAAGHFAAADSYSDDSADSDYGSYPDSYYDSYRDSYYDSYPDGYYNDSYPFYGAGYYPYPVYFFVNRNGFFERFRRQGRGFVGRRGHVIGHGGFGRPRFHRGDSDRGSGRRRGNAIIGHRGPGRPAFPRGSLGKGFRGPRGGVIRSGGGGHPGFPRSGFGQGPRAPRAAAVRNGGFGRPGFPSGGHAGRGPVARSGGPGNVGRPAGNGRR
jgi:hypothetical protein